MSLHDKRVNRTGGPHQWAIRGKLRAIGRIHRNSDPVERGGQFDLYLYRCECGNHIVYDPVKLLKAVKRQSKRAGHYCDRVNLGDTCCGMLRPEGPDEAWRGTCYPTGSRPAPSAEQYAERGLTYTPFPPYADEE